MLQLIIALFSRRSHFCREVFLSVESNFQIIIILLCYIDHRSGTLEGNDQKFDFNVGNLVLVDTFEQRKKRSYVRDSGILSRQYMQRVYLAVHDGEEQRGNLETAKQTDVK